MKKQNLFYIIETFLGLFLFIILFSISIIILESTDYNRLFKPKDASLWTWDTEKVSELQTSEHNLSTVDVYDYYNLDHTDSEEILRIIMFGDSVLYQGCPNVEEIEYRLNKHFTGYIFKGRSIQRYNVVNSAIGGGNMAEMYEQLKALKDNSINIDIITLFSGWNDHWYNIESNPCSAAGCYLDYDDYKWLLNLTDTKSKIINNLALKAYSKKIDDEFMECSDLIKKNPDEIIKHLDHMNTSIYRVDINRYEDLIYEFINYSKEQNVLMIFVKSPNGITKGKVPEMSLHHCTLIDPKTYLDVHKLYMNKFQDIAFENNIAFLDLDSQFKEIDGYKEKLFSDHDFDPIHPGGLGNKLCTELYFQKIVSELLSEFEGN